MVKKTVLMLAFLVAACATEKQAVLETQQDANETLQRTLNYVTLPACDGTNAPGCHDPALKLELKTEAAAVKAAFDAYWDADGSKDAAEDAAEELADTLSEHDINCRDGQSCP